MQQAVPHWSKWQQPSLSTRLKLLYVSPCAVACCADLGVADPEQLLAMNHTQSPPAAAADRQHSSAEAACSIHDSNGGASIPSNSSNAACIGNGLGTPSDLQGQVQRLSGEPGSISNTDTEADCACADAAGPGVSGMQQNVSNGNSRPTRVDMPVVQGAAGAKSGSQACGLAGKEWGLLELDLSFAWGLEDEPVEDVDSMLQSVAVSSR